jgi:GTPase SAR1 family protein
MNGTPASAELYLDAFRASCTAVLDDLQPMADESLVDRIQSARKRLHAERLKILVVGEFSRGKSTFINALMGEPVLPSRVNPTTATINVLRGSSPRSVEVEYADGRIEQLPLPEERVNRYLDDIVTTSNAEASSIRVVRIQLPGRLERIQADVIDTPGVNDLDTAREEITFRYLREADAAVMLLDAQQPLSDSECVFIKDKVFGSDVHRIVFAVNKIDEVLLGGSESDLARIEGYVRERLAERVGLSNAEVHLIASKPALRARFTGDADAAAVSFDRFEQRLIELASREATRGRLQTHLERALRLVRAQQQITAECIVSLERSRVDADKHLRTLEQDNAQLAQRLDRSMQRLGRVADELAGRVARAASEETLQMGRDLERRLSSCDTEEQFDEFRAHLSAGLRSLVRRVEERASAERSRSLADLERDFEGLLDEASSVRRSPSPSLNPYAAPSLPAATDAVVSSGSKAVTEDVVVSAGLSFAAGFVFGPIGVVAAIVGSHFVGKARRERQAAEVARHERERMREALRRACDDLRARAIHSCEQLAVIERTWLEESVTRRVDTRVAAIRAAQESLREANTQGREGALEELAVQQATSARLAALVARCEALEGETRA